jgi:hypothetical protein
MFKDMHYLPDPQGVCPAGLHWATIKSVTPLGNKVTRYGPKTDVVRFDLRLNVDGKEYKIAPDFPLSVHVESNFRKLLIAARIDPDNPPKDGFDLNDLVSRVFHGRVYHKGSGNAVHAGIVPLPPPLNACPCGKATLAGKDYCGGNCSWSIERTKPISPECIICAEGDCTNMATDGSYCYRHCGGAQ